MNEPSLNANSTISHYRILSRIGAGGMGEVYLARDTRLDRTVALKILPAEVAADPERMRRFVQEAKAASALSHPNVAHIYEIGEANGTNFIAMEYVEGQTLDAKLKGRALETAEIIDIATQVADALDEAHSKGITHRDIKPSNVMITARSQAKVLDFGLAKVAEHRAAAITSDMPTVRKTDPGVVMGTVQYMSPEQALGREVDHRTDIFSLGVLMYEMSTGRLPFSGASTSETIDRITHAQPEAIARFNYSVPPELDRIIRKCLEKQPARRYQSARELLVDLRNLKRDSDSAVTAPWFYRQRAGAENLIKEANNDAGLAAYPSDRFDMNRIHFQLAMVAYNLNAWLMVFNRDPMADATKLKHTTLAIARLRFLFIAAKIWSHAGRTGIHYSDQYQEQGLFQRLMTRLRSIKLQDLAFRPVLHPALK